jgi:hypothetical protein
VKERGDRLTPAPGDRSASRLRELSPEIVVVIDRAADKRCQVEVYRLDRFGAEYPSVLHETMDTYEVADARARRIKRDPGEELVSASTNSS